MTVPGGSAPSPEPRPARTALYRFYGSAGELLYVGISNDPNHRWHQHGRTAGETWWPQAKTSSVRWFATREEAETAEVEAIRAEAPLFNKNHSVVGKEGCSAQGTHDGALWEALRKNFPEGVFTCLDVQSVHPAGGKLQDQLNELVRLGLVVTAGVRKTVLGSVPQAASTLYMVAIEETVDAQTGELRRQPVAATATRLEARLPVPRGRARRSPKPTWQKGDPLPPFVTFTSGAELLQALGLVDSITREGVRFISKNDPEWPFGAGKAHSYGTAGSAATMDTECS